MACVTPGWVMLFSRFDLEAIVVFHDFVMSIDVIGIKCVWLLECFTMLENVTVQFSELNGDLNIVVDALGKLF